MKRHIALILLAALCLSLAVGCAPDSAPPPTYSGDQDLSGTPSMRDPVDINVGVLKGPTGMGMVKLMEEAEAGKLFDNTSVTLYAAIDEITPQLVQGGLDMAAVPANMASVLYNNTDGEIVTLAINTLGIMYIVESGGETIQSVEDLRGKTIYASGKGATPEYSLNYLLMQNGIDPETDVTVEYKAEHAECVAAISTQPNGIAMLPQPFVTVAQAQNENIRIALDMNAEWSALQGGTPLVTGVLAARKSFVEEHPEAVEDFLNYYRSSVIYVNENVDEAAELIEKYDIIKAAVAKKALPYCNIHYIAGGEMKTMLENYLAILMEQNPKAIGGAMPDEVFYYQSNIT